MNSSNIYKSGLILMMAILAFTFAACDNDDNKNSNVILEAFGPSPAFRGAKLTFIGRNLDKVSSVVLPDNIEITDIEHVTKEQIKVVIPQNAKPGTVSLKTFDGTLLTSKSHLSYTEPIIIESITPNPAKPGSELTIKGDYLNLVTKVIFKDEVTVTSDQFLTWERGEIKLVLPLTAQSGSFVLADDAVIPMELESEEVLSVILPSVETVLDLNDKKPGDEVVVTVEDIDLVASVVLANDEAIEFNINDNQLSFVLPEGCTDGVISMVAHSGVKVAIAQIGMAIPTELDATPNKDIKAGDVITIKGVNLELITSILFAGMTDAVVPLTQSATEMTVEMPEMAVSGEVELKTASGNSAYISIETLKPAVTSYNPNPVSAGSDLVIEGTNLDLVTSVMLPGDKTVEPITVTAEALTITIPVDAESGEITLVMKNGETVVCSSVEISKPVFCYIPVLPSEDEEIHAGTILTIGIENGDKLTGVLVNNVEVQYINQANNLYINIPESANGNTLLNLISSNGAVEYTIKVIGSGVVETVIMNDIHDLGNWAGEGDGGAFRLYKESFAGVPVGSVLKFYFAVYGDGQMQLNNANWSQWENILDFNDLSQTSHEIVLTQEFLDHILGADDGWSTTAMIVQGKNLVVNKVSIITTTPSDVVLMDTPRDLGNWAGEGDGGAFRIYKESFDGSGLKVGSKIKFYVNMYDYGQVQINDSGWGQWGMFDYADPVSEFELEVDSDLINRINNVEDGWSTTALIIQGKGMIVNKVVLIP